MRKVLSILFFCIIALQINAMPAPEIGETSVKSIAVFVPGFVEGSPTYEMLAAGVEKAVAENDGVILSIKEGGYNQADWQNQLTALAASGQFDVIISSNPAMPYMAAEVQAAFADQKFIILDAYLADQANMYTVFYNQKEQSYINGFFAGLCEKYEIEGTRSGAEAAIIAAQEYPVMTNQIVPGFTQGFADASGDGTVKFRVTGSWSDAAKAAETARILYSEGIDIILPIAGGGNQGVISAAEKQGRLVSWYDSNGYTYSPSVMGSTFIAQERAAYEITNKAIRGTLSFEKAEILGVSDEFVGFIFNGMPTLPAELVQELENQINLIKDGSIDLSIDDEM